jgi:signal transduction histidine kinase
MPRRSHPSLHGLTLAVVLPLAVLTGFAFHGTRTQRTAAWADARAEATRIAPDLAANLARQIEKNLQTIPTYPDPPTPGTTAPSDPILDGKNPEALAKLRDDPNAGLSPAGLPRRALAALRLHQLDPTLQPIPDLIRILTRDAPSVLTTTALNHIAAPTADLETWTREETIRRLAHQATNPAGQWFPQPNNHFTYIRQSNSILQTTTLTNIPTTALPKWAIPRLTLDPPTNALATARIEIGQGPLLSPFLSLSANPAILEASIRRQQTWTFTLLALASTLSLTALAVIHRTIRRERQLSDMKSQFVASVSHELRTPVASIRLMADALEAEKIDPATARDFHRLIAREGARLSTLVANILEHARIEQGTRIWHFEPTDLTAIVSDTLRLMEPLAAEKSITLTADLTPAQATLDPGAIQQALINLLDNAIKFSPHDSTITTRLSTDPSSNKIQLSVTDQGPGIPRSEHTRIFQRFYRPGNELRRETQGTGIGLSLVKAIAEAHHATITLTSTPPQGSTFTLSLTISDH